MTDQISLIIKNRINRTFSIYQFPSFDLFITSPDITCLERSSFQNPSYSSFVSLPDLSILGVFPTASENYNRTYVQSGIYKNNNT